MSARRLAPAILIFIASCTGNTFSVSKESASGVITKAAEEKEGKAIDLDVRQTTFPLVMRRQERVDLTFEVTVRNLSKEDLVVKRLSLETMGEAGNYTIDRTSRPFDVAVPPGETKSIEFWAYAFVKDLGLGTNVPAFIRTTAEYESGEASHQEIFVRRVNGRGVIGVDLN